MQTSEQSANVEGDKMVNIFSDDKTDIPGIFPQHIRNTKSCRQVVRIQILINKKFNIH